MANASVRLPAYRDIWEDGSYLRTLDQRLRLAQGLLSPRGNILVHVDWRVGHVVQVLMDEICGPGERRGPGEPGFRNEIVWGYGGGGHAKVGAISFPTGAVMEARRAAEEIRSELKN